jgi:hypothetical protein
VRPEDATGAEMTDDPTYCNFCGEAATLDEQCLCAMCADE